MARVAGKVALISGGSRGIGAACAELLIAEGASVVIGDVRADEGHRLEARLGARCRFVKLDVTRSDDWASAVAMARDSFGGLDVLVNNAGIPDWSPLDEYPEAEWRRIIDTNLTGAFLGITAAVDELKKSGAGSIISVSSIAGLRGSHSRAGYSASKWGLRGLTKAAALDLGQFGIRVNTVHPGGVATSFAEGVADGVKRPAAGFADVALGRRAEPVEIARLILFLASDDSSFSTGAEFIADGGVTAGVARPRD